MTIRFSFLPTPSPTVIGEVADGTVASAVFSRGGISSGTNFTAQHVDWLRGCAAAIPTEPLFNRLIDLIADHGSVHITWSNV